MDYEPLPITFIPGVNPDPDATERNTAYITDADNIRFNKGAIEKIGGHAAVVMDTALDGCPRNKLSFSRDNIDWEIIGTHTKLYARNGATVHNITPLQTTKTATLGSDPLSVSSGDATLTVSYTSHGLAVGDRIKLTGATDLGGITAATYINIEHIVATVPDANSFTVEMGDDASSSTSGGGSSVDIFNEIEDGECDDVAATGPGVGTPGSGLPGSIQTDTTLRVRPQIWWLDTFGDNLVCGPGNQGKCYEWDGDTTTAPAVITNAPDVDWGWVEDAKLVTLSGNTVANCDTGNLTNWTPGAGSSAYTDDKEDAKNLIGHLHVNGENLVFSDQNKIFRMRWIGGNAKWEWKTVSEKIRAIGPRAGVALGPIGYIFGTNNLYRYNGGLLAPIAGNTLYKYIFENINLGQSYKFFAWFNQKFDEFWFHYATAASNENDRCVIYSQAEGHFNKRDSLDRTAADVDGDLAGNPILAASDGTLYEHETGYNDNGAAMSAYFQISYKALRNGKVMTVVHGLEPDWLQTGDIEIELYGENRAREDAALLDNFTFTDIDTVVNCEHEIRWWSWLFKSNTVDGYFRTGRTHEFLAEGSEF